MSRPEPKISPSAILLDYKMPIPLKIVLGVGIPMWAIPAFVAIVKTHQYDFAALCFALGGSLLLFIFANNAGYRVAWDEDRIYMRDWGFLNFFFQRKPYNAIGYGDIVAMEGRFGKNAGAKSRFMPFEYLEISSRDPSEQDIWIYPLSLAEKDLAVFLVHLHGRRPDVFPDVVRELMRKDGLIGSSEGNAR